MGPKIISQFITTIMKHEKVPHQNSILVHRFIAHNVKFDLFMNKVVIRIIPYN